MEGKASSVSSATYYGSEQETDALGYCIGRAAHEMLLTSSDDVISEYTSAFQQLKERFLLRSSVATLKVCREVRQGVVQLSDTVEYIKDMGKSIISNKVL